MPTRPGGKGTTRKTTSAPAQRSRAARAKRPVPEISPLIIDQTEGGGMLPKRPDGQDPIVVALSRRAKTSAKTSAEPATGGHRRDTALLRAARARWAHKRER